LTFFYIAASISEDMSEKKQKNTGTASAPLFAKENLVLMLAGMVVIVIGMFLMKGGASTDPNIFSKEEVYSSTRITVAPIIILIGFAIEGYAIFRKPKGE